MLRAVASSLLSLMLVATFLYGGCVSCEQYFMFPGKHQPCCNKSGQCERPGKTAPKTTEKQDCNRLAFHRTGNVHAAPMPAVLPAMTADTVQQVSILLRVAVVEVLPDPSPPDRQALNATFLI